MPPSTWRGTIMAPKASLPASATKSRREISLDIVIPLKKATARGYVRICICVCVPDIRVLDWTPIVGGFPEALNRKDMKGTKSMKKGRGNGTSHRMQRIERMKGQLHCLWAWRVRLC